MQFFFRDSRAILSAITSGRLISRWLNMAIVAVIHRPPDKYYNSVNNLAAKHPVGCTPNHPSSSRTSTFRRLGASGALRNSRNGVMARKRASISRKSRLVVTMSAGISI